MSNECQNHSEGEEDLLSVPTYRAARVDRPEDVAQYAAATLEGGIFNLLKEEIWWRDHYQSLLEHGYRLRHRFRPGWRPSWLGTNVNPFHCEDAYVHGEQKVIDAVCLKDNSVVAIKAVIPKSNEIKIGCLLSSPERRQESTNHCAPVLDTFEDGEDREVAYIVMPVYRDFDDPPFYYVEEVIEFVRQTLEGVVYMHSQRVAHRDLADRNIMMDGNSLYPKGFHPSWQDRSKDAIAYFSKHKRRADARPVKYVFVDFGESSYFASPDDSPMVTGSRALDREVPELYNFGTPYNAYAVDIFTLGNVYKKHFISRYRNLDFLASLSESMTQYVPQNRPTATQAFALFEELIDKQKSSSLRWRLHPVDETVIFRIVHDVRPFLREVRYLIKNRIVHSRLIDTVFLAPFRFVLSMFHKCYYMFRSSNREERIVDSPAE